VAGATEFGRGRPAQIGAFTLIELLVVMAVVGILASLLITAVHSVRAKAHSIVCLNHHKQLTTAFFLYVDENEDALPYNYGVADTKRTVAQQKFLNWVNNVMSWELDADNTNTTWIQNGGLGPYLSGEVSPFRCPSDNVLSDVQRAAGWKARVRSISMNAMLGYAGQFTKGGTNVNNPDYRQFFRLTEIPDPSRIFVLIEEHPDSINDGYFLNRIEDREWTDLPASYHEGGAHLAYADGHIERHKWTHASTKAPARPDAAALPRPVTEEERADYDWLMERTTVLQPGYEH
jgi:prepilin-type N-terminal cleavage/methylation domain-containing protein/prepilin-type processing-associated H-X9-DG protein